MNLYLGVTDLTWFRNLKKINPEDINFWQPGGNTNFRILNPGDPFLFKLKAPYNAIAGVGFYAHNSLIPINIAWDTFGNRNGVNSFQELYNIISSKRTSENSLLKNPNIGCIVLTNPIFFESCDFIEVPKSWTTSIVQGKSYALNSQEGRELWDQVQKRIFRYNGLETEYNENQLVAESNASNLYKENVLGKVRIGQGVFRIMVMDAYKRRCAITGERVLPALETAHIKPYAKSGPHKISNGLLLRSDVHKLFDSGYITIDKDLRVIVSNRIREEYENGRDYYKYQGSSLITIPNRDIDRPSIEYIEWHNNQRFKS